MFEAVWTCRLCAPANADTPLDFDVIIYHR
jgi:hypothetical protein